MNANESPIKGITLAILAWTLLIFSDTALKFAGREVPFFTMALLNACFALVALILTACFTGGLKVRLKSANLRLQLVRAVMVLVNIVCFIYAITQMELVKAYTLAFTTPFVTALFSILLLREFVGWHRWISIAGGFVGVIIVLRPGFIPIDLPSGLILIAVVALSLSNILSGKMGKDEPWLVFAFYPLMFVIAFCSGVVVWQCEFSLPAYEYVALLAVSGVPMVAGHLCLAQAFVSAPASAVSPMHYSQLVWAAILGY